MQDAQLDNKWGRVSAVSLEVGSQNGLQPARYNCRDRLFCQVMSPLNWVFWVPAETRLPSSVLKVAMLYTAAE